MTVARPITLVSGASSGIGAAFARLFAAKGHELVLVALPAAGLDAIADEIAASGRPRPLCLAVDLREPDAVCKIAGALAARNLEPAYVVNCAGIGLVGPAAELDCSEQLGMIDVNVRALTELSLAFTASLMRHRGGILNAGSAAGFVPGPGMAVYYATKAYVNSFGEALARELTPKGVRVTTLCPGPVATDFHSRAGVVTGKIPKFAYIPVKSVVLAGYRGLMQGRRIVVPGASSRFLVAFARFLPRPLQFALLGRYHLLLNKERFRRTHPSHTGARS